MKSEKYSYHHQQPFALEAGGELAGFTLAYNQYGELNEARDNVVWVCHALTGNQEATNWWGGLFEQNAIFDTSDHCIICVNVLGSCYGSTGPLSVNPATGTPYYSNFPKLTVRDIVRALIELRKHLKLERIHTLIGGSLGGQQALEWAITEPEIIDNLILLASNAVHSAWGIAFNATQRMAIEADPTWGNASAEAGEAGLRTARAIAMLSYRNYETYELTQTDPDAEALPELPRAASYQRYQGQKLQQRFNAYSYYTLSNAMDSHNVGRGRGGLEQALQQVIAYTLIIGITTDILFPISEQRFMVRHIQNATYEEVGSTYGHDGFLIETQKLNKAIAAFYRQKSRKQILYAEKH